MEGYVFKWINFIRGYKPRYLILKDHQLYCHKKKNDTKSEVFDLRICRIIEDKKKNFMIETPNNDKLHFKTNTENEKKEWIIKLQEISRTARQSIVSDKDKIHPIDSLNELRKCVLNQIDNQTSPDKQNALFELKKTNSCVVEKNVKEINEVPHIVDYLQNDDLNVNPSKNKRFSREYNAYYQEINKNRATLRLSKFEKLVNSHQNLQNLLIEFNCVMENFNLKLMTTKSKNKESFTKVYDDLFSIKQEMKEHLDMSVKNLVEYKEESDKQLYRINQAMLFEKYPEEVNIIRDRNETFFGAREDEELIQENVLEWNNHVFEGKVEENENVLAKKDLFETAKENKIEIDIEKYHEDHIQNIYKPLNKSISDDENDESSFEDCISRMDDVNYEKKVLEDEDFKGSLEYSIIKESIENEEKFKRSLSIFVDDFRDPNYNFEPRQLNTYPKIKCSNSMMSDMLKSLTKDKITLPIHYNEPISMLQKQCEKFQYSFLLSKAANLFKDNNSIYLRMCYIAAFIASEMSLNINRILKPFNPILGETFEYFDNNLRYRFLSEQVSHHPPISAFCCESQDYVAYGDTRCKNKFKFLKGAMEITFQNKTNIIFKKIEEHFAYNKPTVYIKGLIMGTPHYDFSGIVTIEELEGKYPNVKTVLDFFEEGRKSKPLGYFEGKVIDQSNNIVYLIKGNWNSSMYITDKNGNNKMELWKINDEPCVKNTDLLNNYMMSEYSCNLNYLPNENESDLANVIPPTDSRLRSDQRALEIGNITEAEKEKIRIENNQRARHKQFEEEKIKYEPNYFADVYESKSNEYVYIYKGGYWEDRKNKNFCHLHNIFK